MLYILIGIPGSGKSTWAKRMAEESGAYWISRDAIRFAKLKDEDDYFAYEDIVVDEFISEIQNAIDDKYPIIIADATHLNYKSRNQLLSRLSLKGTSVVYVYFNTSLETALKRNSKREGRAKVPNSVIEKMYNSIRLPTHYIKVEEDGEEEII